MKGLSFLPKGYRGTITFLVMNIIVKIIKEKQ